MSLRRACMPAVNRVPVPIARRLPPGDGEAARRDGAHEVISTELLGDVREAAGCGPVSTPVGAFTPGVRLAATPPRGALNGVSHHRPTAVGHACRYGMNRAYDLHIVYRTGPGTQHVPMCHAAAGELSAELGISCMCTYAMSTGGGESL